MKNKIINDERQCLLNQLKDSREIIDLTTTGDSMEPLIQSNSTVYIEFNHIKNISIGDVIAFYDQYGVSVHRCIRKKNEDILERGDGCNLWVKCNWVNSNDIIGKVIYVKYENKRLVTESFGYKLYSFFIVVIGKLSNRVGSINKKDTSKEPHVSLKDQGSSVSKVINRFILLLHRIFVKYEKTE